MIWFVVFAFISLGFILAGTSLAVRRIRRYRHETEARRVRAFAEMAEIAEKKKAEKKNVERGM